MQLWTVDARMLDDAPFERCVTLPPTTPLRQARAGDYIKVGRQRERFWARVDRVGADGSIVATVDNELVLNPDLALGVVIEVSREHVLEICSSEDEELVVEGIRAASRRTGAEDATTHAILGWWETRKAEGTAYPLLPGTRVFVGAEEQQPNSHTPTGEEAESHTPSSHAPAGEEAAESHVAVCHVIHPSVLRAAAMVIG